jgi:hypothetical protein
MAYRQVGALAAEASNERRMRVARMTRWQGPQELPLASRVRMTRGRAGTDKCAVKAGHEAFSRGFSGVQDGMAGIGSYPDLLRDIHSPDMNQAIIASKNLLAVAEATQVCGRPPGGLTEAQGVICKRPRLTTTRGASGSLQSVTLRTDP